MTGRHPGGGPAAPLAYYAPKLNVLEQRARSYLDSRTDASGEPPLTDDDRAQLARIQNRAVLWAALSGTLSGFVIGGLEIYLRLVVIADGEDRGQLDDPWIWGGFYAFVGALSVVEIAYLYWVALKAIARIREVIGIAIKRQDASELVMTGLARGALEMPNPHTKIYGVDPYAMMPRWKLLVWNLLYKAKVGATSFILRVLMRRVLARAVLRGYLPLLAVPLYAGWNAFIIWRVMQEARLRALGPFAISQATAIAKRKDATDTWRQAALLGVAEMIRRSGDAHPNYALLLSRLLEPFGIEKEVVDAERQLGPAEVGRLCANEQRHLTELLTIVAVLAGRPKRAQVRLLKEIHEIARMPFDAGRIAAFRLRLLEGRPFQTEAAA